jgi:hypothetical protein
MDEVGDGLPTLPPYIPKDVTNVPESPMKFLFNYHQSSAYGAKAAKAIAFATILFTSAHPVRVETAERAYVLLSAPKKRSEWYFTRAKAPQSLLGFADRPLSWLQDQRHCTRVLSGADPC